MRLLGNNAMKRMLSTFNKETVLNKFNTIYVSI